ncbi:hypothetical protein [Paenibacillus mendelii]|uniref:Butirosin biosynthesis protein H N-terminal domain-containing protein n=1 Tax=Paenibacillus mendelii TaxID=206163 RepID=A0ABV6J2J0_9BACL|nr:hypothetical protein [Paenibacillus mendelii]MCQ6563260.1 BtrH N-terminal domain-containing protein [Paenibacillus mendelii]
MENRFTTRLTLNNYGFAGMDASQLGAIKSVADFYQIPLTPTRIYGMTGLAFLHVLDERCIHPNAGPPVPEIYRLARNLGIRIEGIHQFAEGEAFTVLQAEAWDKARAAVDSNKPVFAKHIAQLDQTSVITGYDEVGYYIDSWHTGYQHSEDVIPWNLLGLSLCPCVNCLEERKHSKPRDTTSGIVSLHWADPVAAGDELFTFKEAIRFVLRMNEEAVYEEFGQTYFVGSRAYEEWINAIQHDVVLKFDFALVIEVVHEARSHAKLFLEEMKDQLNMESQKSLEEAIHIYTEISTRTRVLRDKYPYEQLRVLFSAIEKEEMLTILRELSILEKKALALLSEIYSVI